MTCAQVQTLLVKLQAVFELPRRLHAAIDNGALEIAVATYADAEPLLRRYGHKVSLRQRQPLTLRDCQLVLKFWSTTPGLCSRRTVKSPRKCVSSATCCVSARY